MQEVSKSWKRNLNVVQLRTFVKLSQRDDPKEPRDFEYKNLYSTPYIIGSVPTSSDKPTVIRAYNYFTHMAQTYNDSKSLDSWRQGCATIYGREVLGRMLSAVRNIYKIMCANEMITTPVFATIARQFAQFRSYTSHAVKIINHGDKLTGTMIADAVNKGIMFEKKGMETVKHTESRLFKLVNKMINIMVYEYNIVNDMWKEQHVSYIDEYTLIVCIYNSAIHHFKIMKDMYDTPPHKEITMEHEILPVCRIKRSKSLDTGLLDNIVKIPIDLKTP